MQGTTTKFQYLLSRGVRTGCSSSFISCPLPSLSPSLILCPLFLSSFLLLSCRLIPSSLLFTHFLSCFLLLVFHCVSSRLSTCRLPRPLASPFPSSPLVSPSLMSHLVPFLHSSPPRSHPHFLSSCLFVSCLPSLILSHILVETVPH